MSMERLRGEYAREATPSAWTRLTIACAIAVCAAAIVTFGALRFPNDQTDFDQSWFAAGALLHGRDPYPLIGPGREFDSPFLFLYPLTTAVIAAPFAALPVIVARALFIGVSTGLLAFLITGDGYKRLPIFLSGAFVGTLQLVQWTPLLACGWLLPSLGFLFAAKPHIGLALLSANRSWRDVWIAMGGMLLVELIAFAVQPTWLREWRAALSSPSLLRSFVMTPGGPLLLLAFLRWRRWDGRLLGALSVIPQTPSVTTTLLLLLIPRTRMSVMLLSLLTFVPLLFGPRMLYWPNHDQAVDAVARVTVYSVYFPALYLVLRRPNVGIAPMWVERLASYLPSWIRGVREV